MYKRIVKVVDNKNIVVGFTTRLNGHSHVPYDSFNLGLNTEDESVELNRADFSSEFQDFEINYLSQIHSNKIISVDNDFVNNINGDGLITEEKLKLLTITVADCGNVMFYDKKNYSFIVNVHAGWRGQNLGIIEKCIEKIPQNVLISDIAVVIGPMIRGENYEVTDPFLKNFPKKYFEKKSNGHYNFYIEKYLIDTLVNFGITDILDTGFDTYKNNNLFYSYRKEGETGRIASFIGLK